MLTLEIHLLRSFVAVSRSQSIKIAAELVGRTQSAVSMQMQRLEDVVGQPILYRTRYGVELTPTGSRLLSHAKRILDEHDEALADITGNGLNGLISVGCPEEYLVAYFPDLLRRFSSLHAGIEIEVICASTTKLNELLKQNRLDLALISILGADIDNNKFNYQEQFVWVADTPYPTISKDTIVPLALPASDTPEYRFACAAIEKMGQPYRIAFASNSFAGLLAITRSGQAISVMTQSGVPDDLHIVKSSLPPLPAIGISLAYASAKPSLIARSFGEFFESYFSDKALSTKP